MARPPTQRLHARIRCRRKGRPLCRNCSRTTLQNDLLASTPRRGRTQLLKVLCRSQSRFIRQLRWPSIIRWRRRVSSQRLNNCMHQFSNPANIEPQLRKAATLDPMYPVRGCSASQHSQHSQHNNTPLDSSIWQITKRRRPRLRPNRHRFPIPRNSRCNHMGSLPACRRASTTILGSQLHHSTLCRGPDRMPIPALRRPPFHPSTQPRTSTQPAGQSH